MADEAQQLTAQPRTLAFQAPKSIDVLNTTIGGQPIDYARLPTTVKTPEQAAIAEGELYQQIAPQQQRLSEMEAEKAAVDARNKAMYAEQEAARVERTESERKRIYDENPYPKLNPTKENVQSLATLFSLMGVIGIGMGGAGKMSAMSALNSMTGMMKGWQEGRADLFNREVKEYEKNMTVIKNILDAADKEADRIYKLLPIDRQKAETEMAALTASLGGQILKQKTSLQGIEQGINFIKDLKKTNDDAWERAFKERKLSSEEQRHRETLASQEKLRLATLAAAQGRRDIKALESIGPALRNIAEQYPDGTANTLVGASNDDKKRIVGSFRAVEESETAADFIARNPRAVGALAAARNFIKLDSIKSLKSDDEAAVVNAKAAIVDQGLDDAVNRRIISKDDAEAAKVLQKKLFGLSLADVQGSGQRGSVYLDKQFQNFYDQSSRPDTLLKIIRDRAEDNNRNLRTYRLNVERNNAPEQFPLLQSDTQERFSQYIKDRAPAGAQIPEKVSKALAGKPEGTTAEYPKGKFYIIRGGQVVEK